MSAGCSATKATEHNIRTRLRAVPDAAQALRTAVREFEREKAKLDRQALQNTAKRDRAIRKAHASGLTMRQVAQIAGVSYQRVGQIVKDS
jgi:hypothetical protein